ncbi:MAG: hypothetical protein JHC23_00555 [Sulfolobus sp.]|nr:hypothetical protein [Sulfolobus sp.]
MEPREVAETVMDRVVSYCEKNHGDTLECLADHSPDQIDVFIDSYLREEENEGLSRAIEKSGTFWDEVKREYEKLWKSWLITKVAYYLGDEIALTLYSILDNPKLDNASKARRLKAYAEVLDKFGDAVKRALDEKKPLSSADLREWFAKLGDIAFGVKDHDYYDQVDYYLSYYDELSNNEKLDLLDMLLSEIDDAFYTINPELRKLEALTNTR